MCRLRPAGWSRVSSRPTLDNNLLGRLRYETAADCVAFRHCFGRHRRPGADLSIAHHHADRAVPAGRVDGHGGAHHGREDADAAGPARHHRERRRRRRQHRGGAPRARRARRLHHRHRPVGHPCRQRHLQAHLRPGEGLRAGRADLRQPAADDRQEGAGGERPQEPRRLDEGEPGQGAVRQPERGRQGAPASCCSRRPARSSSTCPTAAPGRP